MTTRLTRASASLGRPATNIGIEVQDDGRASSWQTSGQRVGRFGRMLTATERAALRRALTTAANSPSPTPDPTRVWTADGSTEHLTSPGLPSLEFEPNDKPPKGFAALIRFLRSLQESLLESPLGAIALEVDGKPLGARLVHLGQEPMAVRLGEIAMEAVLFGADSAIVDRTETSVVGPTESSVVGPGWQFPLSEQLGIAQPKPKQMLVVNLVVHVDALGEGTGRPCALGVVIEP